MHGTTVQETDETEGQLTAHAKAAMALAGKPTGFCGQKWISTGNPICELCNDTGGIASACVCPECQP